MMALRVPARAASGLRAGLRSIASTAPRRTSIHMLGIPMTYVVQWPHGYQEPWKYLEYEVMPRDEFGVPAHVPPELSTAIKHTYYLPPQYYPFLKKLGDDTPELKPFTDKLINGEMTFEEYEHMFYTFAKPLRSTGRSFRCRTARRRRSRRRPRSTGKA